MQGPKAYIPGETFIDNNANLIYDEGIDTPLDTAYNKMGGLKGIEIFPGAKNQKMSSFTHLNSSDPVRGDPANEFEARNYMTGRQKLGGILDPCLPDYWGQVFGVNCATINPSFWYSGDPENYIGWLNTISSDKRILINTGPFDLIENEPVIIIVGYTIGQGSNSTNSVTVAKLQSQFVQQFYQSNFDDNLVSVEDVKTILPNEFRLEQNYPNPFNPSTKISWQSPVGSWQTLKVYDVLGNEVATFVDEYKTAGSYNVDFYASKLSSGIYFYRLQAGSFVETKKMILIK